MYRATAILLALLLVAAPAIAQEDLDDVEDIGNVTADGQQLLDRVMGGVDDTVGSVGDAAGATGESLQKGAAAIGEFLGKAVATVGHASAALVRGLAAAGAVSAAAIGTALLAAGQGAGHGLAGIGSGLTSGISVAGLGIAQAAAAIGGALAAVGGLYATIVGSLRPDAMPPAAFGAVVGAGAAATTGVGSWAGWQVLRKWGMVGAGFAPIAGFSRINDDQLLEHPVRSQIFATIRDHPGIHASQLARQVDIGWGTVSHHLDKLQKARMVAARKVNNQKCYFEQGGTVDREDMQVASAVKGDTASRIAAFVHHHPMTSQKSLAEALGISPALASFHAKKLANLGVLEKMRHGKETLLTTSPAMRRLLETDQSLLAAMEAREDEGLHYSA